MYLLGWNLPHAGCSTADVPAAQASLQTLKEGNDTKVHPLGI